MSEVDMDTSGIPSEPSATELLELRARILAQPAAIRSELEPLIDDALEHAKFRDRVLNVAKDALGQYRLDLQMIRFDLEATKREHDRLMRRVNSSDLGSPGSLG